MKRASVGFYQSRATEYQTLLKEYLELQKDYVSKKRKLQAAKKKKELSLAEVRFLKRKHKLLSKGKALNADKDHPHLPNVDLQTSTIDQLLISNSHQKDEEAEGGGCAYEDVRHIRKIKNYVVQDKNHLHRTNVALQTSTIDQLLPSNSHQKDEEVGGGGRV